MPKLVTTFIVSLTCLFTAAQSTIYPGEFRCISVNGPLMDYFSNSDYTNLTIANDLDSLLRLKRNWELTNLSTIKFLPNSKNTESIPILQYPHLNIGLIEYSTSAYIKQLNLDIQEQQSFKEVLSVLHLEVQIEGRNKSILFESKLDVYVKKGVSNGIGVPIQNLHFSRKGFLEALKKSFAILFDSTTTNEAIELTVGGAFIGDNFILAKASGLPRSQVSTSKGISKFKYNGQEQLIRWGDQLYKDIVLYGKNKTILPEKLVKAFENNIGEADTNPVFLVQEGRDILANKNYTIQLAAHLGINPYYLNFNTVRPIIKLISGYNHFLFNEKDTVAVFEIQIDKVDTTKKIFLNQVSNGIDTSSVTSIESPEKVISLNYDYLIKGKLKENNFEIKISGDRYLREFYFNNKLICIANGNKTPERFVMLDNSISSEILNALFIIGFNSFFQ